MSYLSQSLRGLGPNKRFSSRASSSLVLCDIPSKGRCACWSPNIWKTRLVLNYKGIPYTTEWTEYPDIEPKLKGLGIPSNPPGSWSDYSCRAVQLPDGERIMDSRKIVDKLEALYPNPSLHLEANAHDRILSTLGKAVNAARPMILAAVWRNVLREPSASFFAEDRQRRFGKTLDQLEMDDGGDKAWAAAQRGLESLKLEMKQHKNDNGPFLLGSSVSYGDFLITAIFTWLERADSRIFEKFVGYDESFRSTYEARRPWLERDGH